MTSLQSPLSDIQKKFPHIKDLREYTTAEEAVARLQFLYKEKADSIQQAFEDLTHDRPVDFEALQHACYPFVGFYIPPKKALPHASEAYGVLSQEGIYGSELTHPHLFAQYYLEQFRLIMSNHKVPIYVGLSPTPIPLPFVVDQSTMSPNFKDVSKIRHYFVMPDLKRINDHLADCVAPIDQSPHPLSIFSAERVDLSLQRLKHYSGTSPQHFQGFVLLTNYQRYVDMFLIWAKEQLATNPNTLYLAEPGNVITPSPHHAYDGPQGSAPKMLPQMPAYHLAEQGGQGITLVNIGVGPSNAKTFTDHLAVLRPHCWIMLGHCGGLRDTQELGDYVLAHGYVRMDNVLNENLPPWISIPPLAEIQIALEKSIETITGMQGTAFNTHVRTGTVVTTDNRNWELLVLELMARLRQSRAIAIDMESATIAANGFRFRVPYGTLLCVSDKPLHGEIKLPGLAQSFYQERISQHLFIGIETLRLIKESGLGRLHSRKLRGFDDPPFR